MSDKVSDTVLFYADDNGRRLRTEFAAILKENFPKITSKKKSDSSWHRLVLVIPYFLVGRYVDYMVRSKMWGFSTYCTKLLSGNPDMIPSKGDSSEKGSEYTEAEKEVDHPNQGKMF